MTEACGVKNLNNKKNHIHRCELYYLKRNVKSFEILALFIHLVADI